MFGGFKKLNMASKLFNKLSQLDFLARILVLWGILWGVLGLTLFFLGLMGQYFPSIVILVFLLIILLGIYLGKKIKIGQDLKVFIKNSISFFRKDLISLTLLLAIFGFLLVNFLAALAPELGYDALWYHLTLPKIWLSTHQISYISGGVLYYSVMPKLGEIFFSVGLAIEKTGTIAKLIHLSFGVFWILAAYVLCRDFLSRRISLLIAACCYGTVLVSWLSETAYIDLIVAFYVAMGLKAIFKFYQTKDDFYLNLAAIFIGLNLASKIYGLIIFAVLAIILFFKSGLKKFWKFIGIALVIALPFYLEAYLATGNPLYPVFSIRDSALDSYLAGYHTIKDWYLHVWWQGLPKLLWRVLIYDFTPIFGLVILLPLVGRWRKILLPTLIFLVFFLFWSLIPMQEPRYFLVILPVLGLLTGFVIENIHWQFLRIFAIILAFFVIGLNFLIIFQDYQKNFHFVFSGQSRGNYLEKNLSLSRNFYDSDSEFKKNIEPDKKVLTVEVGNMFYIDFPFWDWSFISDNYDYLTSLPNLIERLKDEGYGYVLLGRLSPSEWTGFPEEDLTENFELIYQKEDLVLYKIK